MKTCFKLILGIVGLVSIPHALLAAEAAPAYPTYKPTTPPSLNYSAPDSMATSSSNAVMVALNAQSLLLKELMQEHQKRAEDLTQKSENEKAKWEKDLVNELQEKSARLQKNIDQAAQPTNDRKTTEADDQLAFLSIVDANLERVRNELS